MIPEKCTILIVDDEASVRDALCLLLEDDYEVFTAAEGMDALTEIERREIDMVLLDLGLPGMDGFEVLHQIKRRHPSIDVVVVSARDHARDARTALKSGAIDYVPKPFSPAELLAVVHEVADFAAKKKTVRTITRRPEPPRGKAIVTRDPAMLRILEDVNRVACTDSTVLITGESGTGKEIVASNIHDSSPRARGEFVAINCATIPSELIESELFGHEKGSFTHAVKQKIGKFEQARFGTLFLDEISALRFDLQAALLRVLQEREFTRVGGNRPIQLSARVIAASNENLLELADEGRFRRDLYYRLNVVPIQLPPLRDRPSDIPLLVEHFVRLKCARHKRQRITFTAGAYRILEDYPWPGNVRELENVIEQIVVLAKTAEVDIYDLPLDHMIDSKLVEPEGSGGGLRQALDAFERQYLLHTLESCRWNKNQTAEKLGIHRNTLLNKLTKLGIKS